MKTMEQDFLSSSDAGEGILVAAVAPIDGSDTAIHTVDTIAADEYDEIILYATNNDTATKYVQIGWGDDESKDFIQASLPAKSGLAVLIPDLILGSGKIIVAAAETTNVITIHGKVIHARTA